MVYVNSVKYACESCIKGHRSSSCHHNERPLFEIKKKGRPVSQCEKCRELRQSKRLHSKCNCPPPNPSEGATGESAAVEPVPKKVLPGKRFIPITPSLPNGLKDALKQSNTASDALTPRRSVDALLNPCQCKGSECNCNGPRNKSSPESAPRYKPIDSSIFNDGLSALALVASCCFPASSRPSAPSANEHQAPTEPSGCCSGSAKSESMSSKAAGKRKRSPSPPTTLYDNYVAGDLEPYLQSSHPLPPLPFSHLPSSAPHLNQHARQSSATQPKPSQAADAPGCCCGTRCECAGCQLHNALQKRKTPSWVDYESEDDSTSALPSAGPSSASRPAASSTRREEHGKGCGPDCPTCVDYDGGVELPANHLYGIGPSTASGLPSPPPPPSFIADYFARAASTSASAGPSSSSHVPTASETTKIDARWRAALGGERQHQQPRHLFALTEAPAPAKLEACCSGACGCGETCGCGYECDGCCLSHSESEGTPAPTPSTSSTAAHLVHAHHRQQHQHHQPMEQARARVSRSPSVSFARRAPAQEQPREVPDIVSERPPEKRQCCCPK